MKRSLAALATLLALTSGCSGSATDPGTRPTASPATDSAASPSPTGEPADICAVITDEEVSAWAGTPQEVSPAREVGRRTTCETVVDPDDGLGLDWSFAEVSGTFEEMVAGEELGLTREDIELTGGVAAVRLQGELAGSRAVKVVCVVRDRLLVVQARSTALAAEPLAFDRLSSIATQVADAYAA